MKNTFKKILSLVVIGLTMSSCSFMFEDSSEPSNPSEPSAPSQPGSSQSDKKYELQYQPGSHKVGDKAYSGFKFKLVVTFDDGSKVYKDYGSELVTSIKSVSSQKVLDKNEKFTEAGKYKVFYQYDTTEFKVSKSFDIDVTSGLDVADYNLSALSVTKPLVLNIGDKFFDTNSDLTFVLRYTNSAIEYIKYKGNENLFDLNLLKEGTPVNINTHQIVGDVNYTFKANTRKFSNLFMVKDNLIASTKPGYIKLDESTITYSDFDYFPKPVGNIKLLIVPIYLEIGNDPTKTFKRYEYTNKVLSDINNYFFGTNVRNPAANFSLKTYFEQASGHAMNISGEIANIYHAPASKYTMASLIEDESMISLVRLFNDAIEYTLDHNPQINMEEYDTNHDGYFDCVHFINNSGDKAYEAGNEPVAIPWASSLWPHQSQLPNEPGTPSRPKARVYESTALSPKHLNDARTITHEQGHMFGIPDYYDYSDQGPDYIGHLDMQSGNYFDWNSWSKFSVGWAKPIVVDGSNNNFTITLHSAATTNECIVVPANFDTYNKSAFDEYFLLELFTNDGNNHDDWNRLLAVDRPRKQETTVQAGIRLYHVDSRLGYIGKSNSLRYINSREDINESNFGEIEILTNNTYFYEKYSGSVYKNPTAKRLYGDFKQLALIQKGGIDTFGRTYRNQQFERGDDTILVQNDLFLTGDKFEFDNYDHFLRKSNKASTKMNNGEMFPYTIEFVNINKRESKIKFTKNF